jgi:hypothetical protein
VHQGAQAVGKAIKQWATEAQAYAAYAPERQRKVGFAPRLYDPGANQGFIRGCLVSEWTPGSAWKFASVGRAIPSNGTDVADKLEREELLEWCTRLGNAPTTDEQTRIDEIIPALRSFTRKFIAKLLDRHPKSVQDGFPELETNLTTGRMGRDLHTHYEWDDGSLAPVKLNTSACLEVSRSKGGAYAYFSEKCGKVRGHRPPELPVENDPNLPSTQLEEIGLTLPTLALEFYKNRPVEDPDERLVPQTAPTSVRAGILPLVARELAEQEYKEWAVTNQPLPMRPVLIPERGQKIRIASMSPAMSVALGQRINGLLLRLLKKSRVHNYSLLGESGVPPGIIKGAEEYVHEEDFTLTSADLSAASDYIPHDIALAVWDGIAEALGDSIPPLYHTIGASLLGPMQWDGGKENKDLAFTSKRGILMGLPLTWPILSILNHFAGFRAIAETRTKYPKFRGSYYEPFVSCGDDFAAAWTSKHESEYFDTIDRLGLKLNEHKTFSSKRSPSGITNSLNGLVFVERLFLVRKPLDRVYNRWLNLHNTPEDKLSEAELLFSKTEPTPTVWVVHRPTLSAILAAKPTGATADEVPIFYKLGPILTQEALKCNALETEIICELGKTAHSSVVRRMRKTNVPIHWPIDLGGWGFPGKQEAPAKWRKAAASILIGATDLQSKLKANFALSKAPGHLRKTLRTQNKLIESFTKVDPDTGKAIIKPGAWNPVKPHGVAGFLWRAGEATMLPVDELQAIAVARTCAFASKDFYLQKQGERTCRSIDQVASTINAAVDAAVSKWKSAKPMSTQKALLLSQERKDTWVTTEPLEVTLLYTGCADRAYDLSKSRSGNELERELLPRREGVTALSATPPQLWDEVAAEDWSANESLPNLPSSQDEDTPNASLLGRASIPDSWEEYILPDQNASSHTEA